jgi:hypothetical protein
MLFIKYFISQCVNMSIFLLFSFKIIFSTRLNFGRCSGVDISILFYDLIQYRVVVKLLLYYKQNVLSINTCLKTNKKNIL